MTRASALEAAARSSTDALGESSQPSADRRLSDSNAAWLGKVVDGRYKTVEVIGRGGMGVVYRVEHLRMGKVAAMKVLHRDLAGDPEVVHRFEREAALVSKLHHPHTVQVFDFGTANGALYLIMEYVRGLDLAHIIQRDGPMPWSRAAPLLAQISGALQEAHELGIVHRDLKPENVLITRTAGGRDYAKVLDFGLAKLEQRKEPTTATDRQQIVGTPYFMSPEQIRGDAVDPRSDIYSFGALMFELITGEHLFAGSTAVGVLTKHLTAEPDAPSNRVPKLGIDPRVDQICLKCLAKEPGQRWRSAAQLAEAIEEVYAETVGYSTGAGARGSRAIAPVPVEESDLRLRRSDIDAFERGLRRQRYVSLGMMTVLALGAVGAGAYYLLREPPPLTEEREPNDAPAQANKIAPNTKVTGFLGKRRSPTDGDIDTYLVPYSSASDHVVTIRVTGVPNLDINLSVTDGDGLHGASADAGQLGEGEVLHRRSVDGPLVITVGETLAKDARAIENVSDPYTLTVTEDPQAGETEPNNREPDANPLEPTRELRGYLDTRDDVDLLRWTGAEGTYNVIVRADGVPLAWHVSDGKLRTPGAAQVTLHKGEIVTLERTDRGGKGPLAGRDSEWSVVVTPVP
jgi:serine/threonine-protein kinase